MTGQITAVAAVLGADTVVEVELPVGAAGALEWCAIPGAAGVEVDNGERPTNEVETFVGTAVQNGSKTKPTITVDIPGYLPAHRVSKLINEKFDNDERLNIRWYYPEYNLIPMTSGNVNVSISTSGVVTPGSNVTPAMLRELASDLVPEGASLFTGTAGSYVDYMIESKVIAANGQLTSFSVVQADTDAPPSAQISDANFGIRQPKESQPETLCHIMSAGNKSVASGQVGSASQLVLRALHDLLPEVIESN